MLLHRSSRPCQLSVFAIQRVAELQSQRRVVESQGSACRASNVVAALGIQRKEALYATTSDSRPMMYEILYGVRQAVMHLVSLGAPVASLSGRRFNPKTSPLQLEFQFTLP